MTKNNLSWIRRLRLLRGMKQEHLAELIGVSQPTLSRLERGALKPTVEQLSRLQTQLIRPDPAAERALARLVRHSVLAVHLIDDKTHQLLEASQPRWREWRIDPSEALGLSLLNYATAEIEAIENTLLDMGWFADASSALEFRTGANADADIPIFSSTVRWERFILSDGRAVRLVTTLSE
ncbi:MAG: helix-turn-helix transcriptional regulator [Pseudorhizobium sp.]